MRDFTPIDKMVMLLDQSLRAVHSPHQGTARGNPADQHDEAALGESDRRRVIGLMRVNHAGEIAAQALYNGQALTARDEVVRQRMEASAVEETDHLAWCKMRVNELGGHTSYLGPFWYWGSFAIGAAAGLVGDKWSLGFVKETEDQVGAHLEEHLARLPENDVKSRAIITQMAADEAHHGQKAVDLGAASLPAPVRGLMKLTSKIMTTLSYRI